MEFAGGGTGLQVVTESQSASYVAFGVACGGLSEVALDAATVLMVLGGAVGTSLSLLTKHAAGADFHCVARI